MIAHSVWLYFRFPLSLGLVEEMLLERGIVISYEAIRWWARSSARLCRPLAQQSAEPERRLASGRGRGDDTAAIIPPAPIGKPILEEIQTAAEPSKSNESLAGAIGGRKHWLWRAVDQDGYVLDEVVQARATPRLPSAC